MPVPPDTFENLLTTNTSTAEGDFVRILKNVAGVLLSRKISIADFQPGFISPHGCVMEWISTTSYRLTPGKAHVYDGTKGVMLSWAANITRSALSLSADTLYYIYLYSNSGVAALEESTTVPVWDSALNMYVKTGNTSRRLVGFLSTNPTNGIRKFLNMVFNRTSEFIYTDGVGVNTTEKRIVTSGSQDASWASFSLAPFVPVGATHAYLLSKLTSTAANDDGIIGLSPVDLGASVANEAPFTVRAKNILAPASIFFGTTWLAISTAQTYYYRIQHFAGTGSLANIECHGARIFR